MDAMDASVFSDILERGETVIKIYKPNAKRFWRGVRFSLFGLFFPPIFVFGTLFTVLTLGIGPFLLLRFTKKGFNNTYYCYTNKRLIIRSGAIGIDYKSLEFKGINLTKVAVGFLDKKHGTGNLFFSSPSAVAVEG